MLTQKRCVACPEVFEDESPGLAGVVPGMDVGICPNCRRRQDVRQTADRFAEETCHGEAQEEHPVLS